MTTMQVSEPRALDVQAGALKMRYYLWNGTGPTVVMLHNSGAYARIWEHVVPYLVPDFRVIALDQRGHGDTDRPAEGYAGEDFASDLEQFLDVLRLDQVALVGHSLGGRASQIFAGNNPERVTKIAIVGGPHPESFGATPEQFKAIARAVKWRRQAPVRFPNEGAAQEYLGKYLPQLTQGLRDELMRFSMNREPDGAMSFKYDGQRVADTLSHKTDDLRKYVRNISSPVLFMVVRPGYNGLTIEIAKKIEGYFTAARVETVVVDGEHYVELENPKAVGEALRRFLVIA